MTLDRAVMMFAELLRAPGSEQEHQQRVAVARSVTDDFATIENRALDAVDSAAPGLVFESVRAFVEGCFPGFSKGGFALAMQIEGLSRGAD